MCVDLIDDGQEIIGTQAMAPVDLIDAKRLDLPQFAMRQAPLDEPFDRAIDRFPTGLKHLGGLSPAQPSRPARQESHHGAGHRALSVAPRNILDDNSVLDAFHSPWRIEEIGGDSPQGHEQPTPLGQAIVAGCGSLALRAASSNAFMRLDGNLDGERVALTLHSHLVIDETHKMLHPVQDGLNLELNS